MNFKIFLALMIEIVSWAYPLATIFISSILVTLGTRLIFSDLAINSFLVLIPVFYLTWLSILIILNTIGIRMQSLFFDKPRLLEVNPLNMSLKLLQFTLLDFTQFYCVFSFPEVF